MATTSYSSPVGGSLLGGSAPVVFTPGDLGAQAASNVVVKWDLDNDGDFDQPEEDITGYVLSAETFTGRDFPSSLTGLAGPGTLKLTLDNSSDIFSKGELSASPLNTAPYSLRGGRKIRLECTDGVLGSSLITYVGIGAVSAASNTALIPALPTGLVAGDTLLIVASIRNSGTGTVNTPAGWANLLTFGNLAVLGRRYEVGDVAPTVTFAGGVANATTLAQCMAFRGCHQTLSQLISVSATQLNGSAQNVAYPARTIADANQAVVLVGWKQDDWTSVAQPAGFTEISDTASTLGDDAAHVIDYVIQTTATNVGSGSLVVTGGAAAISRALVFALRPAVDIGDPVLLVRDRFTRPASTTILGTDELGTAWVTRANGGYGAVNGKAEAIAGLTLSYYNVDILETIETSSTDHYVQAAIPMQVQDGRVGIVARYIDTSNYVRCYYSATDRGVLVEQLVGGVLTTLGLFLIEPWEGMTLGLGIVNQEAFAYLGGTPLEFSAPLSLTHAAIAGTSVGIYGKWETHSDVAPAVDDFYAWDRVRSDIDGVLGTWYVSNLTPNVKAGPRKVVELTAEGPLAGAAAADIPAPRIVRTVGETDTGTNHSVPAGCIVGDIMVRAGVPGPPHPLPTNSLSHIGPHAVADGKALAMARAVELTERGFLHETQEGGVAFEDRDYRGALSSRAWFSDTPGTGQFSFAEIEPYDEQSQVVNRARAMVAATCPTVVDVSNQGDSDGSALDVTVLMPAVAPGQLVIVFIACSADATNVEFGCPPPWKEHRTLRQAEGNGMRVFSLICDGTESGITYTFYKGSSAGTFLAHIYVIDDWYGTDDGIKMGRVSTGTNAYPITPGWSRAPALYIVFQCVIGSTGGILWGPLSTPPPVGYDYDSLEGLVWVVSPASRATGVESVYKLDVTDTEQPRPWLNVFDDYLILETVVLAVRGYNGPLEKPTIDNPKATGGQGLFVTVDDDDSQVEHNFIRANQTVPSLHYREGDARIWGEDVVAEFSDDRPIISVTFYASRNSQAREQAMRRRVSEIVTVTATGNTGLGFEADFHIESVSHSFTHGTKLWVCRWELSPVPTT